MVFRVLACAIVIGAAFLVRAQEALHRTLLPPNSGRPAVSRSGQPTVEIPTYQGGPTIETPTDQHSVARSGQPTVEIPTYQGGPTIETPTDQHPVARSSQPTVETPTYQRGPAIETPTDQGKLTIEAQSKSGVALPQSAWLDLRQNAAANSNAQSAPDWVEALAMTPAPSTSSAAGKTVFRIRTAHPPGDYQVLFFRLLFDDKAEARPEVVAWDESGTQVLRSGELGSGVGLPSSDSVMIPMNGISTLDIEVPGDGKTIRGAYLDWMTSNDVVHPLSAEHRDLIREPFSLMPPLHSPAQDTEQFGTVTATLAAETIRIGPSLQQGAAFQFGMEAQPLLALLTFEVASPRIDSPPEVYVNGEDVGAATLTLPELADPAYRGEMESLLKEMHFQYTGWLRGQKLIPVSNLKVGTNDVTILSGSATSTSAIRGTQVQLKYLWEKSDYLLQTNH